MDQPGPYQAAWLTAAIQAACKAGEEILTIYETYQPGATTFKADQSPLTAADLAANRIIKKILREAAPEIPYFSEESMDIPYEDRASLHWSWLVDPLDGTKEFVKKNGEFTVNIALLQGSSAYMGVVYAPVLDRLFFASKGEGAFVREKGMDQRMKVRQFTLADEGLRIVASRSHRSEATEQFISGLKDPQFHAMGSSLKIMLVANGEADIYPRFAPTMEWDTAASQIILEEAGGKLLYTDKEDPLTYNKADRLNPFFIAWGGIKAIDA